MRFFNRKLKMVQVIARPLFSMNQLAGCMAAIVYPAYSNINITNCISFNLNETIISSILFIFLSSIVFAMRSVQS